MFPQGVDGNTDALMRCLGESLRASWGTQGRWLSAIAFPNKKQLRLAASMCPLSCRSLLAFSADLDHRVGLCLGGFFMTTWFANCSLRSPVMALGAPRWDTPMPTTSKTNLAPLSLAHLFDFHTKII